MLISRRKSRERKTNESLLNSRKRKNRIRDFEANLEKRTNDRIEYVCVCACACTCPLKQSTEDFGRPMDGCLQSTCPTDKERFQGSQADNGTVAQIYVCTSGTEIEAAPNTHTFAIVSEFLRDLRSAQVYINYQARVYSAAFHAGIHSCGLTRIYICIVYIICLLSMFRFFFFLRTLPCFVDKMDKNNHGVCITRKKKKK